MIIQSIITLVDSNNNNKDMLKINNRKFLEGKGLPREAIPELLVVMGI